MKKLSSNEIRSGFLEFFRRNKHQVIEGSSVLPKDDPSLLFINAGMAPLKPYFLGHKIPTNPRMANVQPCIRTKDIADVGDRHHLTMFEMLGSWSIGDYFKTKAVELAYELLVDVFGFDKNRLFASVYQGNPALNLEPDLESYRAWEKCGIPTDRIVMLGEDNFWSAGDTGPCGPCTEVFFDCGEAYGPAFKPGMEFDSKRRYIEIWNAGVFMEFNKRADGGYDPLPFKSVDTGSGLERMSMVMNGVDSVYETDLFAPLMAIVRDAFSGLTEVDYRIMSDHMRASSFILSAGVIPSNEGQGYIPRRLLRKCIAAVFRSGRDLDKLVEVYYAVAKILGEAYPELVRSKDHIVSSLKQEIAEFAPVIRSGIKIFDSKIAQVKGDTVPGSVAFELASTFGLPLDVIASLAQSKGLTVDQDEFEREFKKHQDTSRVISGSIKFHGNENNFFASTLSETKATEYVGYDQFATSAKILMILTESARKDSLGQSEEGFLVFDRTPFYAESGGQIADTGTIQSSQGKAQLIDCQKVGDVFVHRVKVIQGSLKSGEKVQLSVDYARRQLVQQNHSATHLLHAALRQHLGNQVVQKGSLVEPGRLRFDFQHKSGLSDDEIKAVETTVNQWIWQDIKNDTRQMAYPDAVASGAMALFGENYGDLVRVVKFGQASTELCGGCHVPSTGEIGMFLILTESSIAKGVRRIEAITGTQALSYVQSQRAQLKGASEYLGIKPEGLIEALDKLKKQLKDAQRAKPSSAAGLNVSVVGETGRAKFGLAISELARDELTHAAQLWLEKDKRDLAIILTPGERHAVSVFVTKARADELNASVILKSLIEPFGGRGGGKPLFAQGGFSSGETPDRLLALMGDTLKGL